jgi:hypothetical protein
VQYFSSINTLSVRKFMGTLRFLSPRSGIALAYWPGHDLGLMGAPEHAVAVYALKYKKMLMLHAAHAIEAMGGDVQDCFEVASPLRLMPNTFGEFDFTEAGQINAMHLLVVNAARYASVTRSANSSDWGEITFDVRLWDLGRRKMLAMSEPALVLSEDSPTSHCIDFAQRLVGVMTRARIIAQQEAPAFLADVHVLHSAAA